jgi:hypothetical protein
MEVFVYIYFVLGLIIRFKNIYCLGNNLWIFMGTKKKKNDLFSLYIKNLFGVALVLFFGRVLSAFLLSKYYGLSYTVEKFGGWLPVLSYSASDVSLFKHVSTWSLVLPGIVVLGIFLFFALKKDKSKKKRVHMNSWLLATFLVVLEFVLVMLLNDWVQFENSWYGLIVACGMAIVASLVYWKKTS